MLIRLLLGVAVALTFASCKNKNETANTSGSSAYGGSSGTDDFYQAGGTSGSGGEYDYVYEQGSGETDPYASYTGDDSSYSYESAGSGSTGNSNAGSSSSGGSTYSAPSARYYTVQKGDNLFRISQNHGTTVAAIQDANNIQGTLIRPGEQLVIP